MRRRFDAVEHDVTDKISEDEVQAADEPLCAGEVTATWSTADREPDMLVIDTAVRHTIQQQHGVTLAALFYSSVDFTDASH